MSTREEILQQADALFADKKYLEVTQLPGDDNPNLKTDPELLQKQADAYNQLGIQEYDKKNYDQAVKYYQKATEADPELGLAYYNMGLAWYARYNYEEAISTFSKAIEYNANDYYAHYYRGSCWYYKREYDKAIQDYNKSIQLSPDSADAFYQRALCWYYKREYDKAIQDYDKSIQLSPESADAFYQRALCWFYKKEYDKAIQDYDKSIQLSPDSADAFYQRALCWYYKREYDKAIQDFDKSIQINPFSADVFYHRGLCWYYKGDYYTAIKDFDKSDELKPDLADTFVMRGNCWYTLKVYDNALKNYEQALRLSPNNQNTIYNLGLVHEQRREYLQAIDYYSRVIQENRQDREALYNRGLSYFEIQEYQKAEVDFSEAIRLKQDYADAYYNRGFVYEKLNKETEAKADFTTAIIYYEEQMKTTPTSLVQDRIIELKTRTGRLTEIKTSEVQNSESRIGFIIKTIDDLKLKDQDEIRALKQKSINVLEVVEEIEDLAFADNKEPFAHYTKLNVADIIVSHEEPRLRFYNVIYMNDPEEGKILFDCINDKDINRCYHSIKEEDDNNIYLGSFLPAIPDSRTKNHEDELVMWRTYGKDEDRNEAAGCSIIIQPDFFDREKTHTYPYSNRSDNNKKQGDEGGKEKMAVLQKETVVKQTLYQVLYFNKKTNEFLGEKTGELNTAFDNLRTTIKKLILHKDGTDSTNETETLKNKAINSIIYRFLSEIRYLIKSSDYAFENELRVIQYANPESNRVKIDDNSGKKLPKRLYVESNRSVQQYISKIILGPKVPNPNQWLYLKMAMQFKRKPIELKLSSCKFQ